MTDLNKPFKVGTTFNGGPGHSDRNTYRITAISKVSSTKSQYSLVVIDGPSKDNKHDGIEHNTIKNYVSNSGAMLKEPYEVKLPEDLFSL